MRTMQAEAEKGIKAPVSLLDALVRIRFGAPPMQVLSGSQWLGALYKAPFAEEATRTVRHQPRSNRRISVLGRKRDS